MSNRFEVADQYAREALEKKADLIDGKVPAEQLPPLSTEEELKAYLGELADLETADKSDLVAAINEVAKAAFGGITPAVNQQLIIDSEFARKAIGDLNALITNDKSNLVAAINEIVRRLIDATGTVISTNADYAEIAEWSDGNKDSEIRTGYFVCIDELVNGFPKIRKATSIDDVRGVSVYNPAFSGNAGPDKYGEDGHLLPMYSYVGIMGVVPVIDNGTCTPKGRCMPANDGTAIPSDNSMGYSVLDRLDAKRVLIAVEPGADTTQRIKRELLALEQIVDASVFREEISGARDLRPDVFRIFGEVSALEVNLLQVDDGRVHEYCFEFTPTKEWTPNTDLVITPEPRWVLSQVIQPGYTYQVSILRGLAVMIRA